VAPIAQRLRDRSQSLWPLYDDGVNSAWQWDST
jgi:hypothetical protein